MMNKDTDIDILEFHGKSKIDMPSGTAKYIQNILATENTNHQMVTHSIRSGNLTGKHQVLFTDQENCSIEITYSSGARSSYAKGIYMCISELSKFDNGIISFDKICGVSK